MVWPVLAVLAEWFVVVVHLSRWPSTWRFFKEVTTRRVNGASSPVCALFAGCACSISHLEGFMKAILMEASELGSVDQDEPVFGFRVEQSRLLGCDLCLVAKIGDGNIGRFWWWMWVWSLFVFRDWR
jgi:hypothetical protein